MKQATETWRNAPEASIHTIASPWLEQLSSTGYKTIMRFSAPQVLHAHIYIYVREKEPWKAYILNVRTKIIPRTRWRWLVGVIDGGTTLLQIRYSKWGRDKWQWARTKKLKSPEERGKRIYLIMMYICRMMWRASQTNLPYQFKPIYVIKFPVDRRIAVMAALLLPRAHFAWLNSRAHGRYLVGG